MRLSAPHVCSLLAAGSLLAVGVAPSTVSAQDVFPSKPIQLILPFPPGGATDAVGRIVAKKLGDLLGKTVVVDNRPGAGTIVGAGYVAKSPPDGYTLMATSGTTFTVNPALYAKLPYDPQKNFEPIGMIGSTGLVLLANRDVPVNNLKEFVAAARASPGKYSYGSFGAGTTAHFAGEELFNLTGVKLLHVPYKGSAPAMTDLIGGQIPFTIDTVAAALPQVRGGKVKAIAVTTAKRSALLTNVPTVAESGYPGMDTSTWIALVAPRGLPPDVHAKLEKALADTLADPDTRKKLAESGIEPSYAPGKQVSATIDKELPQMRAIAQRANIKLD